MKNKTNEAPAPKPEQKVTVGRTVHFVHENGAHMAAIVVDVRACGIVELAVLPPTMVAVVPVYNRVAEYSEEPKPGTWHWVERELLP